MKDCVDAQLRHQQAGFRKDRSCTDQIATPRIIVEQSIEWNSSLYINFIDHEKAFDSVDRTTLRSCTDQIATPRIIVEQSIEWNSSLYINFIDHEKAFDSVDRTTLLMLLRHYGVPQKIVNIIQSSYDGLNCKIVHGGQLTDSFEIKTDVSQGCLLSPFFFFLVIDWTMKTSTSEGKYEIQWTSKMQLDDLDFSDDLALLSQTQQQMRRRRTV
ncbi:unnamed protein product [Schistosoma margrebowiei]|uniref:Uncharacterized protein n=1 Tax=Schistosoma margrebowiei TaxID=48269 RepID=A0A183N6N6_9TREM|nr:unnamed protein product [Schistosoma margrebowiei]